MDQKFDAASRNKHLYNTTLTKARWSLKRFGFWHLVSKPIRTVLAPIIIRSLGKSSFTFGGETYNYFYNRYNITWANERCVEVPIVKTFIDSSEKDGVLEVGNVLSHYYSPFWDILDKFERGRGVINEDIVDFKPNKRYGLIVSISTLEHVGYDDNSGDSKNKIIAAVNNLKSNCLKKDGKFVMTAPIGYNPNMDEIIKENRLDIKQRFMKKIDRKTWLEVSKKDALVCNYGKPFLYANAIMIGEYGI